MTSPAVLWRWLRHWRYHHLDVDRIDVLGHVEEAAELKPRYGFMVVMACGIATLGLLQSSAAVIIGAMLISPLMGPIVQLGMSLAVFDFAIMRRALRTLAVGIGLALAIAVLIVLLSPLKAPTAEILARTEPTLFDLLVAVFSGLAGAYATITRKGETIVGVAIATALMPPLCVAGYGLAVLDVRIAGGAAFLFMTNLLAIALAVTLMARWYGFGGQDTPEQTAWRAGVIVGTFVLLSVPLGLALRDIAQRAVAQVAIRNTLDAAAREAGGRISALRVDRAAEGFVVDAVLLTPHPLPELETTLRDRLQRTAGTPVALELREVLLADSRAMAAEQASLAELRASVERLQNDVAARPRIDEAATRLRERAVAALGPLELLADGQQARWRLRADAGLGLAAARRLETALRAEGAPEVQVIPAPQPLPAVSFAPDGLEPDPTGEARLADIVWTLARWQAPAVEVVGADPSDDERARKRAEAVAARLRAAGVTVARVDIEPRPAGGEAPALANVVRVGLAPPA